MSPCPAEETKGSSPSAPEAAKPGPGMDPEATAPSLASSAEAIEFVRFCRCRRRVGWPELYDEMILVACRGLFHGYGFEELARCGIVFNLAELPQLARLVGLVVAEERPPLKVGMARRGRAVVGGAGARPDETGRNGGIDVADAPDRAPALAGLPAPTSA